MFACSVREISLSICILCAEGLLAFTLDSNELVYLLILFRFDWTW